MIPVAIMEEVVIGAEDVSGCVRYVIKKSSVLRRQLTVEIQGWCTDELLVKEF